MQTAPVNTSSAQSCQYSPYWGENGELWDPNGPLQDYSYVGYHKGNAPIPYRQRSAKTSFGPGRFTITDRMIITKGVLRGAGKDATILYFPKGLVGMGYPCPPENCWDWRGGVIQLGPGSEIGLEDLTIEFPPHKYTHHNGRGYNGPELKDCVNCWIKNVKVINADEGIGIRGEQNTISDVEIIGGYHNYIHMSGSGTRQNLVTNFQVSGGSIHGLSGNWGVHGGVYSNGWGKPVVIEPDHNGPTTTGLLYSNIQGTGGKKKKLSDTFLWNYMNQNLCPLDIHQAQLARRLGIDMSSIADAGPDQTVLVGQVMTLDGGGSSDPDGDALTSQGDFGDGSTSAQAVITDTYADVGAYTVEVIVRDGLQHGNFSHQFDVPSGEYAVTLHFDEVHWKGPDKRLFDVYIEGTLVLENYDLYAAAGGDVPIVLTFPGIMVDDGQLTIDFVTERDHAVMSAIQTR
jgi:Malectin domain/PKD domain